MSNRVLVLQDIVKALSHETDTSEALCQSFVKELFAIVAERLMDGESVTLKGVGRFDVDGGEVRFVADPDTAAAINSAFDCFEAKSLPMISTAMSQWRRMRLLTLPKRRWRQLLM